MSRRRNHFEDGGSCFITLDWAKKKSVLIEAGRDGRGGGAGGAGGAGGRMSYSSQMMAWTWRDSVREQHLQEGQLHWIAADVLKESRGKPDSSFPPFSLFLSLSLSLSLFLFLSLSWSHLNNWLRLQCNCWSPMNSYLWFLPPVDGTRRPRRPLFNQWSSASSGHLPQSPPSLFVYNTQSKMTESTRGL